MSNDNNKPKKFFGLDVSDTAKYAITIILAIILVVQVVKLF